MKILVKTYAGSHLFGTDTPESDTDYKGVYIPTAEQILLGNYPETIQQTTGASDSKNSKYDIDVELYSLTKFMKMLENGDTAAIELLFTPDEMIVEKSVLWETIVSQRDQLISKKVKGIIGYSRHQANKYGIKGLRLDDLTVSINELKRIDKELGGGSLKLKHAWDEVNQALKGLEHVRFVKLTPNKAAEEDVPAIDILGKKFDWHCGFTYVLQSLKKTQKEYGRRAREAKSNGGIDFKALSHALRVSIQGIELLKTGKITLPLKEKDVTLVRSVKLEKMESPIVSLLIEEKLAELEELSKTSTLRESLDKDFVNELIIEFHGRIIRDIM